MSTLATATSVNPPHPANFTPWADLLKKAESRYKAEMTAALEELDRAAAQAGQVFDVATVEAAEAAGHLEQAAYAAFHRYMAMADTTRNSVLDRARQAYDSALGYAQKQYDQRLSDAEKTYKTIADDAARVQRDVKAIAS